MYAPEIPRPTMPIVPTWTPLPRAAPIADAWTAMIGISTDVNRKPENCDSDGIEPSLVIAREASRFAIATNVMIRTVIPAITNVKI